MYDEFGALGPEVLHAASHVFVCDDRGLLGIRATTVITSSVQLS